ncbi:unnamed protein product [Pleuronectes platessa]|uniref:Uncharacterized protein n=1 Tax=Pleuronectes platessa TaxID=8262 RepID=A0A9N7Z8H1_PLEPL|nr:unnamed protein product [Pleuronectes platessa]
MGVKMGEQLRVRTWRRRGGVRGPDNRLLCLRRLRWGLPPHPEHSGKSLDREIRRNPYGCCGGGPGYSSGFFVSWMGRSQSQSGGEQNQIIPSAHTLSSSLTWALSA